MGQAWAQAQAGSGSLVQGHLTLYENKNSQGIFILVQGPGQNPWPWSLLDQRFLVLPRIYQAIPWEFSVSYRVHQACTSEKKIPWEFFFRGQAQGPGPGPGPAG